MAVGSIIRIDHNDTDLQFKEKVNSNFATLVRGARERHFVPTLMSGTVQRTGLNVTYQTQTTGTVTFPSRFSSVPKIVLTANVGTCLATIVSKTQTGFTYAIRNTGSFGVPAITEVDIDWIAMVM